MNEDAFAKEFFNFSNTTVNTHEEWLLREYSRLMHREAIVKREESKFSKTGPTHHHTNEQTGSDSQHNN